MNTDRRQHESQEGQGRQRQEALLMKTSDAGLKSIMQHEGLRLTAYPDPGTGGEPWTIGVGHTGGVKPGDTCTEAEAMEWLREDVADAEECIDVNVAVTITQAQFDALVSFVFNVGCKAFKGSTLLARLNARDYEGARQQFGRWNKAGGRELPGLTRRRADEAAAFDIRNGRFV